MIRLIRFWILLERDLRIKLVQALPNICIIPHKNVQKGVDTGKREYPGKNLVKHLYGIDYIPKNENLYKQKKV